MRCEICPHNCEIAEGGYGFCGARRCVDGVIISDNYGKFTSLALDPIEKKPLYHFYPGSRIFSAGSFGCNMKCSFCQNYSISQGRPDFDIYTPEQLCQAALRAPDNIGVAFTYNEPLISYEFLMDSLGLLRENGLKTVLVSNGQINPGPLEKLAPLVDAWNIDIKAWDPEFYKQHGGFLETAKHTVEYASRFSHLEVTTLVIPEQNDNDDEIAALSEWLAGVSPETPYHLSRYFPIHKYGKAPTPKETLYRLADIARRHLKYVYVGNV